MSALDIFNDDAFSLVSMTAAVNKEKYRPGQMSASGIFEEDGVNTTTVYIEKMDGKLGLVEPSERGGPGEVVDHEEREAVPFAIPHYERDDSVKADEVQNVRAFGTEDVLETIEGRVTKKTSRHAQDLTMTLEHQRVGAAKGIVLSKSGRVMENLYTRFGIATPADVPIAFSNDAADMGSIFDDLRYGIEDSVDSTYSGIDVWGGRGFHTKMWRHKSVKETLLQHSGATILRGPAPDMFEFGSFVFHRYRTGAAATADHGAAYIGDDEARVTVRGVPDLFLTRFAPADYEETVNTIGLPFYARQFPMPNGKGRKLEVQMNAISICTRPETLRRLTSA